MERKEKAREAGFWVLLAGAVGCVIGGAVFSLEDTARSAKEGSPRENLPEVVASFGGAAILFTGSIVTIYKKTDKLESAVSNQQPDAIVANVLQLRSVAAEEIVLAQVIQLPKTISSEETKVPAQGVDTA